MFRFYVAAIMAAMLTGSTCSLAGTFSPEQAKLTQISRRLYAILKTSGIQGVGQDVLKCYQDNVYHREALKLCVVYDVAALKIDRSMMQFFAGAGMEPQPAPLFTNQAFDARMNTYGEMAFRGDREAQSMVNQLASKVINAP